MKNFLKNKWRYLFLICGLLFIASTANAEGGINVLAPLVKNAKSTIDGSKFLIYGGEALAASIGFMMTRKWTIFGGIAFLMLYLNLVLGWTAGV